MVAAVALLAGTSLHIGGVALIALFAYRLANLYPFAYDCIVGPVQ